MLGSLPAVSTAACKRLFSLGCVAHTKAVFGKDDGYFHMDLAPLGISFPFMGRAEHELYISANGCKLRPDHC